MKSVSSDSGVANLQTTAGIATSDQQKCEALNNQFKSVFTEEDLSSIPTIPRRRSHMPEIKVTLAGVRKLMRGINTRKAPGPDGVPPMILQMFA